MSAYSTGSVRVIVGSSTVRGYGTNFLTYVDAGDLFRLEDDTTFYEVAAITTATKFTLSSRYANTSYQTSRTAEHLATAGVATKLYSGTLSHTPVILNSVVFNASIESFTDDGAGVLTGDGSPAGSGTISYDDGAWSITLGTDLTASAACTASYFSGDTLNSMTYQIVTDFTPHFEFPELSANDIGFPKVYTKAVRMIDSALYNASINSIHVTNASITNASIQNETTTNADITNASIVNATILNLYNTGNIRYKVIPKKANYTATDTDHIIVVGGNTASITITAFNANATTKGKPFKVVNNSSYIVNVGIQNSNTIEGKTNIKLQGLYTTVHLFVATTNLFVEM